MARALGGDVVWIPGTVVGQLWSWDGTSWVPALLANVNVDAGAAIAGTKIAPNFGAQNVVTTGALSLGTTPALTGLIRIPHGQQISGRNSANTLDRSVIGWGVVAANTINVGDSLVTTTRIQAGTSVTFHVGAPAYMTLTSAGISIDNSALNPVIIQATDTTAGATGDTFAIRAQAATGTGTVTGGALVVAAGGAGTGTTTNARGGPAEFAAGDANNATTTNIGGNTAVRGGRGVGTGGADGNLALHSNATELAALNFQSMQRGAFIANAAVAPTGDPAAGGFMYALAGALIWRGSGGSLTTMGAT